jgi:alpha-tubulin suppressor-like RCC1 family protein
VVSIARGYMHFCSVADGALYCWGDNSYSQLGLGAGASTTLPTPTPTRVDPATTWSQVCTAEQFTCALATDGRVWCWGSNVEGRLGSNPATIASSNVPRVVQGLTGITQISCTGYFACARNQAGRIHCWGSNGEGDLGRGFRAPYDYRYAPAEALLPSASSFQSVSVGQAHACALSNNQELFCWGRNSQGQVAQPVGTSETIATPVQVAPTGWKWTSVSAGLKHTCAVRDDGTLWCWGGSNNATTPAGSVDGEVGLGTPTGSSEVPARVGSSNLWREVTASVRVNACALTVTDELWCWGNGEDGQLGDGSEADGNIASQPRYVGVGWAQAASSAFDTCGLRNDNSLWCWGRNDEGELGNGTAGPTHATTPQCVEIPLVSSCP